MRGDYRELKELSAANEDVETRCRHTGLFMAGKQIYFESSELV